MDKRIIKARLESIRSRTVVESTPLAAWRHRTADHLAPGEYRFDHDWIAHSAGDGRGCSWPAGKTVFVAFELAAPARAGLIARLAFTQERLEGLLRLDGRAHCGIDGNHARALLPQGILGSRVAAEAEFVAEPRVWCEPSLAGERGALRSVAVEYADPELEAASDDLHFTALAVDAVEPGRRKELVGAALEEALLAVDLTGPAARFRADLLPAALILRERLAALGSDPEQGRVFLTGHSHIDTAWLWPLKETVRKCGRTFGTAIRLMERYPAYRFSCSQPQLYAYAKRHYPELYVDIRRLVAEGRWETTGGMWVECDCNVPSGEALIRQFLRGIAFFRAELGTRPRSCWLPDVFGYPASLPQIMRGCGIRWFYTNKLHWQARNKFPYNLFRWEGIDGSSVIAHIPRLAHYYNGSPTPEQLLFAVREYQQIASHDELMLPFGFGDGGGGPTEEMLAFADRARGFPGLPRCRQGGAEEYFAAVEQASPELPAWRGELYLETHRGTYTTQGGIKRANRRCELALRDAEILGCMAKAAGHTVDLSPLGPAWEAVLLHQFHDILPGSSIAQVYADARLAHAGALETAGAVSASAASLVATTVAAPQGVVVLNTLSWARRDGVVVDLPSRESVLTLADSRGRATPAQRLPGSAGGATGRYVLVPDSVPALGYEVLRAGPSPAGSPGAAMSVSPGGMESPRYLVQVSEAGEITRLYDKRAGREVLGERPANRLQLFQDGPEREAAWNVHATFERREYAWEGPSSVEVLEHGPVRAVLRVKRAHRGSRLEQDITLWRDLDRIDFVTRVHWEERQVMLKVAFPVAVLSATAAFEVQFGAVERPTHTNTSWDQEKFEVPAHRWADLSEAYYGVSLLNDCKYGYDVRGNVLRLTLLRGAEWPDPGADVGEHEITYSLFPHAGDWRAAHTVERAAELNVPLVSLPTTAETRASRPGLPAGSGSFFSVEGPAILETWKPAEDGDGDIVRLYEPCGGRGRVQVKSLFALASVRPTNLVEEPVEAGGTAVTLAPDARGFAFTIQPFQIATFRLRLRP